MQFEQRGVTLRARHQVGYVDMSSYMRYPLSLIKQVIELEETYDNKDRNSINR